MRDRDKRYTVRDTFVLRGMGFPADWQTLALWK